MWLGLIGAAYAAGLKQHLAIDLLLLKQKGKRKLILELIILIITVLFTSLVLIYGGFTLVKDTYATGQISPSLGINMGLVYLCLPISGIIILLYSLVELVKKVADFNVVEKSEV
ncbi:TRAP transporter small permease [Seminibacterium arietis]|uniref:TRAP transporter small permease protein n=1 Tax=Seminibacterium arietis TaxID=1173502 RepID=A0ABW3I7G1_9PAST